MTEYYLIKGHYKTQKEIDLINYYKKNLQNHKIENYEKYIIFANGLVLNSENNEFCKIYLSRGRFPQISIYINNGRKRFHIKQLLKKYFK